MIKQKLSETRIEQLSNQPIIEASVILSEDRKWLMHKTVITDIKPAIYMEKVIARGKG